MNGAVMAVSSREGPGRPDDLLAGSPHVRAVSGLGKFSRLGVRGGLNTETGKSPRIGEIMQ